MLHVRVRAALAFGSKGTVTRVSNFRHLGEGDTRGERLALNVSALWTMFSSRALFSFLPPLLFLFASSERRHPISPSSPASLRSYSWLYSPPELYSHLLSHSAPPSFPVPPRCFPLFFPPSSPWFLSDPTCQDDDPPPSPLKWCVFFLASSPFTSSPFQFLSSSLTEIQSLKA